MAGNSSEGGRSVTSKIVAILLTFTDGEVHTLTEVARLTSLPTSTVHRLITELAAWGLLERTDDVQYHVGLALREIRVRTARVPGLQERARLVMDDLSAATGSQVRLGVLSDGQVCYIEKVPGTRPATSFAEGATAPAHATAMGKALLAFSPPGTVDSVAATRGLKAFTSQTLVTLDSLRRALALTRTERVAVSRWELTRGVSTVAAPVFGGGGSAVAALELNVGDLRNDLRFLRPALFVAARSLSRELATVRDRGRNTMIGGQWGQRASPAAPTASTAPADPR